MNNNTILKVFIKYIKHYSYIIISFLIFFSIFAGVFSLYNLLIEAVVYSSILCLFLLLIFLFVHFSFYYKKHRQLVRIKDNIALEINELPKPLHLIEADYQEMLKELFLLYQTENTTRQMERNESIDYYTTWVHQIKTPISVMRLILQEEDTEENKELLVELFRIEQYVEMVLCYFRLDSAASDFVFKEYFLDDIIKQAIRKYAPQFIRKKIRLIYKGTDAKILTDEKWFLFIFEQVLSNAIKYTKMGSITILIENETITITDTGIGIAAEDLPRIFEKGFTGYNGREHKKSTGLGLYLCKQAANKLAHKISVTSCVGHGTTFTIQFSRNPLEVE